MLLTHNFIAGWRNLLKYKTQNIISIACLSVGIVCLCATLYFIQFIQKSSQTALDEELYSVQLKQDEEVTHYQISSVDFKEMLNANYPGVEAIYGTAHGSITVPTKDKLNPYTNMGTKYITPETANYMEFHSAITGKKIENPKVGSVIIEERTCRYLFEDLRDAIGKEVICNDQKLRIEDVCSTDLNAEINGTFVIAGGKLLDDITDWRVYFKIKDKKNIEKITSIYNKQHEFKLYLFQSGDIAAFKIFIPILLFLGSCVLIIGLTGYLKMQIQLFSLRSREIALRRCNGARPFQLFMLLCAEITIIITIASACSFGFLTCFGNYISEFLSNIDRSIPIMFSTAYIDCAYICVLTLIVTIIIAWLSVRRTLKAPLGQTAGKNSNPKRFMHSMMLVIQVFICSILFYFVLMIGYFIQFYKNDNHNFQRDIDDYKEYYFSSYPVTDPANFKTIDDATEIYHTGIDATEEWSGFTKREASENGTLSIIYLHVKPNMFDMLKYDIKPTLSDEEKNNSKIIPVYVAQKHFNEFVKNYNLTKYASSMSEVSFPDGQKLKMVGYANVPDYYKTAQQAYQQIDFYYVNVDDETVSENKYYYQQWTIIKPSNASIRAVKEELDDYYHEHQSQIISVKVVSLDDEWFKEIKLLGEVQKGCGILIAISLACIILSIYSTVSLDTRGRKKEVAIRKVHGAKTKHIMKLFGMYYVKILAVAFSFTLVIGVFVALAIGTAYQDFGFMREWKPILLPALASMALISTVTFATIWKKIYDVARINTADKLTS